MPAYDVLIWGSTGFTGQLVARYFAEVIRLHRPALRWALVGRDTTKLRQLSDSLTSANGGHAPEFLVASAAEQFSTAQLQIAGLERCTSVHNL